MNIEWIDCVRWCHSAEATETVDALIESLVDLCRRSRNSCPVVTLVRDEFGIRNAGYVVLYPGSLASVGHLRSESHDPEMVQVSLTEIAKELFQNAFDMGAEMVQAISPLIASSVSVTMDTAFSSPDPQHDLVLRSAGMIPVAKLVEMECEGIQSVPNLVVPATELDFGELEFIPHHRFQPMQWSHLIESTYVETRDVPELNGRRNIESTLAGYASMIVGIPESWWGVQCNSANVGCLLLTPTGAGHCEITYLGLLPEWRG
ncbi:MAG TPA: hypothetical protein VM260_24345, partial [Pirellula sp.]|nr:hypothetical protein [Pirellula sp.]